MRPTRFLPAVLLAVFAAVLLWRASLAIRQGQTAYRHQKYLREHPFVGWIGAQAAAQNGWTLVGVQDAGHLFQYQPPQQNFTVGTGGNPSLRGNLALWLLAPPLPASAANYNFEWGVAKNTALTVQGVTPDGETVDLPWQSTTQQANLSLVGVMIPPSYPDSMKSLTVKIADRSGHAAQWQVTNLPPTKRWLTPTTTNPTTFHQGPVTLQAVAWRGPAPYRPSLGWTAQYTLTGQIQPISHHWEVVSRGVQWEWGPLAPQVSNGWMSMGVSADGKIFMPKEVAANGAGQPDPPYHHANRAMRLNLTLNQFETYTETVTFHQVKIQKGSDGHWYLTPTGSGSLKTPSGVTVTLDDALIAARQSTLHGFGQINYALTASPKMTASLPHSPLWSRYQKPVAVSCDLKLPPGWQMSGSTSNGTITLYGVQISGPIPKTIPSLTATVTQRVDLQSIPAPMTVRVLEHQPRDK